VPAILNFSENRILKQNESNKKGENIIVFSVEVYFNKKWCTLKKRQKKRFSFSGKSLTPVILFFSNFHGRKLKKHRKLIGVIFFSFARFFFV